MGRTSEAQKIESNLSKYGRRKCSTTASVSKFYILQIVLYPRDRGLSVPYSGKELVYSTPTKQS